MRILSFYLAAVILGFSGNLQAAEAEGQVFYKLPSGELVHRDVTLEVPSRGEGDVILRGETTEFTSIKHFTVKKKGKTTFYVIFKETSPEGKVVYKVFRGAYLRGTNQAKYYGDIYVKTQVPGTSTLAEASVGKYVGGFWFKADID